jgi:hypothetical protein
VAAETAAFTIQARLQADQIPYLAPLPQLAAVEVLIIQTYRHHPLRQEQVVLVVVQQQATLEPLEIPLTLLHRKAITVEMVLLT